MLYPKRWTDQFKTNEELEDWKVCWAEELAERGVTFDEIKRGLARCIELYGWPPSFPEFLQACRPSLDPEHAFHEALKQMRLRDKGRDEWSSAVIFHAAVSMGRDLMSYSYQQVKARWANALDEAKKGIENGSLKNEVHRRPILIEATKQSGRPGGMSEVAVREFAKMKEILSSKLVSKQMTADEKVTIEG